MADPIYKVVEVVGTSELSMSKAIDNAITHQSVIKTTFLLYHAAVSAIAGG